MIEVVVVVTSVESGGGVTGKTPGLRLRRPESWLRSCLSCSRDCQMHVVSLWLPAAGGGKMKELEEL